MEDDAEGNPCFRAKHSGPECARWDRLNLPCLTGVFILIACSEGDARGSSLGAVKSCNEKIIVVGRLTRACALDKLADQKLGWVEGLSAIY